MRMHVYGIIDSGQIHGPVPAGHGAGAVTAIASGDIAAVVSPAPDSVIEASVAHVWHHEHLLAALMERHAVLPMRFGTICRAGQVSALLRQRSEALRAGLRLVRGRVEMAVRITLHAPAIGGAGRRRGSGSSRLRPGQSYLRALVARQGDLRGDAVPVLQEARTWLEQLSLKVIWHGAAAEDAPVKASCLVAREGIAAFADGLRALERPELRLSCTGPWAPYSFAGEAAVRGTVT